MVTVDGSTRTLQEGGQLNIEGSSGSILPFQMVECLSAVIVRRSACEGLESIKSNDPRRNACPESYNIRLCRTIQLSTFTNLYYERGQVASSRKPGCLCLTNRSIEQNQRYVAQRQRCSISARILLVQRQNSPSRAQSPSFWMHHILDFHSPYQYRT